MRREYFGDHLYHELAIDEAPPAAEKRKDDKDDADAPSFGDLNGCIDEVGEALDGIRSHLKRGAADSEGRLSFDAVRRRIADARDALAELEEHLGGNGAEAKDEEPEPAASERERTEAFARARDGQPDHRRDFDPARTSADSRGMAHDIDLEAIFPARPQADGADAHGHASSLDEIFGP
jgi:hypothetical protein